jgi:FKBP-type peptidyl-prolyl cis-trans isomerase 2
MEKAIVGFLILVFLISGCTGGTMEVKNGDVVKVHYTGKLESGEVFDSSEGREPLEFTVGKGEMIKGFDAAVVGMKVEEKKTVTLEPGEAYGEPKEELVQFVSKERFGEQGVKKGDKITAYTSYGQPVVGTILEVTDEGAKVDFNHELAGKRLIFDIELVNIER